MNNILKFVQEAREHNHTLVDAKRRLRALSEGLLATDGAESLRVTIDEARKARDTAIYYAACAVCAIEHI